MSADLRSHYAAGTLGNEYCRPLEVVLVPEKILHSFNPSAKREQWLRTRSALVQRAISDPEIIYARLEDKGKPTGHQSQVFAVLDPTDPKKRHVAVVVSLANRPGEPESTYHRVISIFPGSERYFYGTDDEGSLMLKSEWKKVR